MTVKKTGSMSLVQEYLNPLDGLGGAELAELEAPHCKGFHRDDGVGRGRGRCGNASRDVDIVLLMLPELDI
jgi:hypothetical protein